MKMQCPRCHNQNAKQIFRINGQFYCRSCIQFHRVPILKMRLTKHGQYLSSSIHYSLDFELSKAQKKLSNQLVSHYQNHRNCLVLAVCGSGKTEIVFEVIRYALSIGHRVCFCIPRRELVQELYQRVKSSFRDIPIGLVYGGHIENLDAQFVICTMHQLYRFENDIGFDLMIADEVDAFPFYGNGVLQEIFDRCCLGQYIKLSATLMHEDIHGEEVLIMNRRYHGFDLPIPHMIIAPDSLQKYVLKYLLHRLAHKKVLIYVPTVACVNQLVSDLNTSHHIQGVSSKHKENQKTIQALKNGQLDAIVTTTLLERGVTIEDVQVIVYHGQHSIFDQRTLIQIAGRVGRKPNHPTGKVYVLTSERTKSILQCIKTIKKLNRMSV